MQPPGPPYWPPAEAPAADIGMSPSASAAAPVSVIAAVRRVFDDPEWKHNLMFALIFMVIPIVGPIALSGWMCEAQQRRARNHPHPVPYIDFGDFGEYIKRGLSVFLVQLVVTIPVLILVYAFMGGAALATVGVVAATEEPIAGIAVGILTGLLALFVMLAIGAVVNAAQTRAELTENFSEALSMGKLFGYAKATFWRVVIKNFVFMWVALGIIVVGLMLCYFGVYPAAAVLQISAMHLRFAIYDDYLANGGEPIPLKPQTLLPSEVRQQQMQQQGAWPGH